MKGKGAGSSEGDATALPRLDGAGFEAAVRPLAQSCVPCSTSQSLNHSAYGDVEGSLRKPPGLDRSKQATPLQDRGTPGLLAWEITGGQLW
jgi:hypothetical protein